VLVTIGACATSGGIQALRNFKSHPEMLSLVYAHPDYVDSLSRSTGIADHVKVDYELRGCPVDKGQLLEVLSALIHGRRPNVPSHSTCVECKLAGRVCVMVAEGTPCMGPVTHAGCGALCPGYARGCYGCFGPSEAPNTASLAKRLTVLGVDEGGVRRAFLAFNANAEAFRKEGLGHGD
jgi:coenzyme F420-reducing hydrogenase gamma subunit